MICAHCLAVAPMLTRRAQLAPHRYRCGELAMQLCIVWQCNSDAPAQRFVACRNAYITRQSQLERRSARWSVDHTYGSYKLSSTAC